MSGSESLSQEQREKIANNRREAIAKREAQLKAQLAQGNPRAVGSRSLSDGPTSSTRAEHPPATRTVERNGLNALQCADVKLSLLSRDRFEAELPFNATVNSVFRTIPSKTYNATTKRWNFSLADYPRLIKQLEPLQSSGEVKISGLPLFVRQIMSAELAGGPSSGSGAGEFDLSLIDSCLVENLFPFQRAGINFGILKGGRVLIADEMGLGKTVQALGLAAYYRQNWPLLIVCPSSLRYTWDEAIRRWLPSVDEDDVKILNTKNDKFVNSGRQVVITSYDLMVNLCKLLQESNFNTVILDESHSIKNFKTKRYKAAEPILKKATRVILLSGTPALSRPEELFCQIHCLRPKVFHLFKDFGQRYCDPKKTKWGIDYSGSSNMEELRVLMEATVMIRRMKCDVLSQLPSKTRTNVVLNKESVKTNVKGLQKAALEMQRDDLKGMEKRGALLKFYAETAMAKQESVLEYIEDLLNTDQTKKFLVFAHHAVMMSAISSFLSEKRVGFILIDGNVGSERRKRLCDQFQSSDSVIVAVLSITACNTGLTLTAASTVVFAELFWNPGTLVQAEDRVHRVGQEENVEIIYLCATGTADDYLWPLLQQKLGTLAKAGLSKNDFKDSKTTFILDKSLPPVSELTCESSQRSIMDFFESISDTTIDDFSDLDPSVFDDSDDEACGEPAKKRRK